MLIFTTRPGWRVPVRRSIAAAAGCVLALGLVGCGSSDDESADSSSKIKAGVFPLLQAAIAYDAADRGLFENAGVDYELVETAGGAQTIPAMLAGDFDVVYANYTTALLAAQQGLPVRIACGNDVGAEDHALIVDESSKLETLADLKGAKIAVNNLQNIGTIAIYTLLEDAGIDREDVTLVELPFPDMQSALDAGDVDVIWQVEPFKASALAAGNRELSPLFTGPTAGMPVAGWLTTEEFAKKNADTLKSFCGALGESVTEMQGNRERLVELVPEFTDVPADVVAEVSLPEWDVELDADGLQKIVELMLDYEIIDEAFDVKDIIVDPK